MRYSETAAAAVRLARLATSAERHAALADYPVEFRDVIRATAITLRAVPLHWREAIRSGRVRPASVPDAVRLALSDLFPSEFPPGAWP
jgi:hypothetical protein